MKLKDIQDKYGEDKFWMAYDMLLDNPQSDLVDELLSLFTEEMVADLMSNFDGDNEEADYDNT
jgi:hypothetical protein